MIGSCFTTLIGVLKTTVPSDKYVEYDQKEIEYYAANVNAWFNTKLERDKSLLVLSAGAIGLLVTLLTTVGVNSIELLFVFAASMVSFVICIVIVLAIFSRNAKYLEELVAGKVRDDQILSFLDNLSIIVFIIGVLLAVIIGLATATNGVIAKGANMSDKSGSNVTFDSINGARNLAPQGIEKRSFNGAQNLIPQKKPHNNSTNSTGNSQLEQSTDSSKNKSDL